MYKHARGSRSAPRFATENPSASGKKATKKKQVGSPDSPKPRPSKAAKKAKRNKLSYRQKRVAEEQFVVRIAKSEIAGSPPPAHSSAVERKA